MRFKLRKLFSLSLGLGFLVLGASRAEALTFVPYIDPNPPVDVGTGTANTVFYLDSSYGGEIASPLGFTLHAFNTNAVAVRFSVAGAAATAANTYIWLYADTTVTGTFIQVPIDDCSGLPIGASGECNNGTVDGFAIGVNFNRICTNVQVLGCSGANTVAVSGASAGFHLRIVSGSNSDAPPGSAMAVTSGVLLNVVPQSTAPTILTPLPLPGFFPGDHSIIIDTSGLIAGPSNGSSPAFISTYIAAQKGGAVPSPESGSTVYASVPYRSSNQEVTGFENSTAGTPINYDLHLGVQDSAGALFFSTVDYPNVFATDIQGFLRDSKCFVATASYRNGRAPGVMLLRHFRDEVLVNSEIGRDFIGWYYRYGPIAADWLIAHPIFRSIALMALRPLQAFAWVTLHPAILAVPFVALLVFLGFFALFFRRRISLFGFFLLALTLSASEARASDQPYIDSLISELPKDPNAATAGDSSPFIHSIKKKLTKEEDSTGFSEREKKEIGPDSSEGYTQRIQKELPPVTGSAIDDYRKGKPLHANKGSLNTRSAFGFNFLASANRTYTAGTNQQVAYETVYGNGWVPEFNLHYEWRPFTASFIKKFGLYGSVGTSFTKAFGVFDRQDTRFGATSKTKFTFIVLPVNVGLIYRLNVFDFMWPYFAGGPSIIGLIENRNDKQKSHHGYDFGYWFTGGVAFGLDWLSPKASWDQYETAGVKHSYFNVGYSYLESVAGGLAEFTVDGVEVGFTFEL